MTCVTHTTCFCKNAKGHRGPSGQVACCIFCQGTIFLLVSLSNASRNMEVSVLFSSIGIAICSQEQEHFPLRHHFSGIGGNSVQYVVPDSFQATPLGGIS